MIFLRRDLVREVGGFQSQFDGSQDYDLLLRVSERTEPNSSYPARAIPLAAEREFQRERCSPKTRTARSFVARN